MGRNPAIQYRKSDGGRKWKSMITFDVPNINVEKKSNEQNMQNVKDFAYELVDQLNYVVNNLNDRIEILEALKSEED
jgi:flagellar basal body P-ring protein FlgI